MKILLICAFFPPEIGSASHLYFEIGQSLKNRGHDVTVMTGFPRYHVIGSNVKYRRRLFLKQNYHGIKVLRVFNLNIPWNVPLLRGINQFFESFIFGIIGNFLPSFDIALVYSPPLPLAFATLILARLRGKSSIMNVQDIFPKSAIDLGVLKSTVLIKCFRAMEIGLYKLFDLIIVHSEGNRKYIINSGAKPSNVKVIQNWVDTESISPGEKQNIYRSSLNLMNHFIVSFAGVMGYSQDLTTVIKCALLLKDHKDICFLLVGDGVEKTRLENMARKGLAKNIHFLPMQQKHDYPKVLAASDLCLVTLSKEVKTPVVPSKILSIMSAGRPILASLPLDGDGPKLIREANSGICISPGEPTKMARAILEIYHDTKLRSEMSLNGRKFALNHFSLHCCTLRLERLFKQTELFRTNNKGKLLWMNQITKRLTKGKQS
jgi:glycosyltransferase involved in cell wall biosynthesis